MPNEVADSTNGTASPDRLRRDALGPWIEQLGVIEPGPTGPPSSVSVDGHELELGKWERQVLRAGDDADERFASLLTECLAFQVQCRDLLRRLDEGPMPAPNELPAFLDRLVLDLAVGLALQEELQRDLNSLIRAGELSDAKQLTAFRTKIVQNVADLKERIGAEAAAQAETRSAQMILPVDKLEARRVRAEPPRLEEAAPEAPTWEATHAAARYKGPVTRVARPVRRKPRNRLKPMLGLLAVLTAVWAVFILPGLRRTPGPPPLSFEQFRHLDAVVHVVARPPSLFVRIDADQWQRLAPGGRRDLLEEIGRVAGPAGYSGAHAVTTDGVAVGQWLRESGAQLLTLEPGDAG